MHVDVLDHGTFDSTFPRPGKGSVARSLTLGTASHQPFLVPAIVTTTNGVELRNETPLSA
jgi:hypothetical protein